MAQLIGIDTGGTYTDAVLFEEGRGVIASAKSLTTKHDLSIGVRGAIAAVLPAGGEAVGLVSLSTTLATNALVEGHGSPVCLILIGFDAAALQRSGLGKALGGDPVVFIAGGHQPTGDEQAPLDLEAARAAILEHAPRVAAFAVAAYFAVRNPSHEIRLRALVRDLTGLPVTCSHELSSQLDAPRRAMTAVLNARLIPLLQQLILAVTGIMEDLSIRAPLMVVKGDGSLISAAEALHRPVETILSGPAASVVGAHYLAGEGDVFVVDMGGTTTDIALLREGRPVLNRDGATVGGFRTMVEAVAVHTFGLGGDSEVRIDPDRGLVVGPRRAVPLSLLGHLHPQILTVLEIQHARFSKPLDGRFALRLRPLDAARTSLSPAEQRLWGELEGGPVPLDILVESQLAERPLRRLVDRGLVIISAFTPSDAAHVLGLHDSWSKPAAVLGAALWARREAEPGWQPHGDGPSFARAVVERVAIQSGRALVAAALAEAHGLALDQGEALGSLLVDQALARADRPADPLLDIGFTLRRPLVAIGAPVRTYYPAITERLNTRLIIPPHAEVTNAVGAVAGGVLQRASALITAPADGLFRLHLASGVRDFHDLEEAARQGEQETRDLAEARARAAGASEIEITVGRADKVAAGVGGNDIFIESVLTATATGRPRLETGPRASSPREP